MPEVQGTDVKTEQALLEQAQKQLIAVFKEMPHEIPLLLFTSPGKNEPFSHAARELVRSVRQIAPKVSLREYDITHELAKKWNVDFAPTLLFDPERYNVRWLGAPVGEEGRTFVEALIMMGYRRTNLSDVSLKILQKLDSS
jgi:thioredoxin reductase (NADPH)